MTREAKIGMLTGLGVIVLIGVLLSEYLGDPKGTGAAPGGTVATGKMQPLPIGNEMRQQLMQPVSVPGMSMGDAPSAGGTDRTAMIVSSNTVLAPAFAAEPRAVDALAAMNAGPTIGKPVAAELGAAVPVAMKNQGTSTPPTISVGSPMMPLAEMGTLTDKPAVVQPVAKPALVGKTYETTAGDNLAKIAKKFYGAAKQSDVNRIVSANPTVLKDVNAPLVVGKKLLIPNLVQPTATGTPTAIALKAPVAAKATEPLMIYPPGVVDAAKARANANALVPVSAPPKEAAAKTYEVKSGDTLEKIAKRLSPSKPTEFISKLKAANGIKDASSLQVGQKLKLPA